jgi:hypothetical protein
MLERLRNWNRARSKEPWASFEIDGFEQDGRVKVRFNFNKAFIEKINALGFQAETDEDTVQLFFYTSMMRPAALGGEQVDARQAGADWQPMT